MAVSVECLDENGVQLSSPLLPNINHRNTVFGGSLASLATLAAWALVHTRLERAGRPSRVVVMTSRIDYHAPATGDFIARCESPSAEVWARFLAVLDRRGRARLELVATVESEGVLSTTLTGTFVAIHAGP